MTTGRTGLGTSRDKRTYASISVPRSSDQFQLFEDLYHGDDTAATIADVIPQEMVRAWINVVTDDDDEEEDDVVHPGEDPEVSSQRLSVVSGGKSPDLTASAKLPKVRRGDAFPAPASAAAAPKPVAPPDPAVAQQAANDAKEKMAVGKKALQKLQQLEAQAKFFEALVWARVFGGSLMVLGIDDGGRGDDSMAQPLDEKDVRKFEFLAVFDRWDVDVYSWYRDPKHEKFGLPESYRIRQTASAGGTDSPMANQIVHETRIIRFDGTMVNRRRRIRNAGWADSIYIKISDVIRDFASAWGGAAHLMQDFAQMVFKMKGLQAAMAADKAGIVLKRMTLMDMSRSMTRAVPIDADGEEIERQQTPLSSMPEMLDRFALRLAAAAHIPVTRLFGQSPAGLNATGDNDVRNFYDYVGGLQIRDLLPKLNRVLHLIFVAKDGPTGGIEPKNWSVSFNPLWQLDELQQATMRKTQADTDASYITNQVLTPEEVAMSRFGGDAYSVETTLDSEARAVAQDSDAKIKAALKDAYDQQPDPADGSPKPLLQPIPTPEDKALAAQKVAGQRKDWKDKDGNDTHGRDPVSSTRRGHKQGEAKAAAEAAYHEAIHQGASHDDARESAIAEAVSRGVSQQVAETHANSVQQDYINHAAQERYAQGSGVEGGKVLEGTHLGGGRYIGEQVSGFGDTSLVKRYVIQNENGSSYGTMTHDTAKSTPANERFGYADGGYLGKGATPLEAFHAQQADHHASELQSIENLYQAVSTEIAMKEKAETLAVINERFEKRLAR
jgi:phage-related protein (TIGR01555 family)